MSYSLSQLATAVKNAHNMITIESCILTEVYNRHSCTFAKHVEQPNGNQKAWVERVNFEMAEIIEYDRSFLFSIIPTRFYKTEMYKRLSQRISTN